MDGRMPQWSFGSGDHKRKNTVEQIMEMAKYANNNVKIIVDFNQSFTFCFVNKKLNNNGRRYIQQPY
jgi:hypothetical protein